MFLGVPPLPFALGAGSCLLLGIYANLFFLLLSVPVVFVLRQMTRRDEMIFHLLGLRLQFRSRVRNLALHGGTWVFSPLDNRPLRQGIPNRLRVR